jgi:hypothetical protein
MPMDAAIPFAQVPTSPEPIIAQVRRQLADEVRTGLVSHGPVLDRVADRAVRELWGSRIKTFVPVLALRQAREMLRQQDLLIPTHQPQRPPVDASIVVTLPAEEWQRRDVLAVDGDVVSIDDRDVLRL